MAQRRQEGTLMACLMLGRKKAWFTAALWGVGGANRIAAQDWPIRQPIRVISPASAGSTSDIMARVVFEQVGQQLGQTVVVENHGGAGTTTGMAVVAKSPPTATR